MLTSTNTGLVTKQVNKPADDKKSLLLWDNAITKIRQLVSLSSTLHSNADARRKLRYYEVDVDAQREAGKLLADEIYIPVRLCNLNILREQPKYVAYIRNARRAALFKCVENPALVTSLLENDFTDKFRYPTWELDWYKTIDCLETHGYGIMEVVFDTTKPGHFRNETVTYEDFAMPQDSRDVQSSELLARTYHLTKSKLEEYVASHNFSQEQVAKVTAGSPEEQFPDVSLFAIQKLMFRERGIVYVAWSCSDKCDGWLREPRQLYLGIDTNEPAPDGSKNLKPIAEVRYPYVIFPYSISEDPEISQNKGRVYLDEYSQSAASSLMSSLTTAHRRASVPYFIRDDDSPNPTGDVEQIKIVPGSIINSKVKPFQLEPPSSDLLQAIQAIGTQSSQEAAQINYAVNNRQDSRKTATEVQSAQSEQALLGATQVALFSASQSEVLLLDWRIYRSRVLNNLITPSCSPKYFQLTYVVKPSGDTDVIEKQEKINNMKQTWPVVQSTPIAMDFLQKLLMLQFPEDAPMYNAKLMDDDKKGKLIAGLATITEALAINPKTGQLEPDAASYGNELKALFSLVSQITGQQYQLMNIKTGEESPQGQQAQTPNENNSPTSSEVQ